MSELDDDIARGCLKNGEPLEARRGSGWWSARPEQEQEQAPTDMDIWNDLQRQNDQLRAENEKLREALMGIYQLPNDSNIQYAVELVTIMQDRAQQALKEVE